MARFNDNTTECIIIQHILPFLNKYHFLPSFLKNTMLATGPARMLSALQDIQDMNSKTIIFPDSCRVANDVGSASFGGRGGDYAEIR